jgi:biopolymer transport protein ExbB
MDPTVITYWVGNVIYIALASIAIWGAFCVIVVWRRVAQTRFRSEDEQLDFLESLEQPLLSGDFDAAEELCEGDGRAMPQLVHLAVSNRQIGYAKVRALVTERFQRDVLSDLEYRLSWVYTVIKTAPMVGLRRRYDGSVLPIGYRRRRRSDPVGREHHVGPDYDGVRIVDRHSPGAVDGQH